MLNSLIIWSHSLVLLCQAVILSIFPSIFPLNGRKWRHHRGCLQPLSGPEINQAVNHSECERQLPEHSSDFKNYFSSNSPLRSTLGRRSNCVKALMNYPSWAKEKTEQDILCICKAASLLWLPFFFISFYSQKFIWQPILTNLFLPQMLCLCNCPCLYCSYPPEFFTSSSLYCNSYFISCFFYCFMQSAVVHLKVRWLWRRFSFFTHAIMHIESQTVKVGALKVSLRWVQMKVVFLISVSPQSFFMNWKEPFYFLSLPLKELFLHWPTSISYGLTLYSNWALCFPTGLTSRCYKLTGDSQPIWGSFQRWRWILVRHSHCNRFILRNVSFWEKPRLQPSNWDVVGEGNTLTWLCLPLNAGQQITAIPAGAGVKGIIFSSMMFVLPKDLNQAVSLREGR